VQLVLERLSATLAKGLDGGLGGAVLGVGIADRYAAGVFAVAVYVVAGGGRLEVAVQQLELVAAGQVPVGESTDL
jgi:hypothetical protein